MQTYSVLEVTLRIGKTFVPEFLRVILVNKM